MTNELDDVFGDPAERLVDPLTGEIVNEIDPDSLFASLGRAKEEKQILDDWMRDIKHRIASLSDDYMRAFADRQSGNPSTSKTFRIRGNEKTYKLTMPNDYWDYGTLKKVWSDPRFVEVRDELLAIDRVKVQMRAFKKAVHTNSDDEIWMEFARLIEQAFKGPSGSPIVEVDDAASKSQA